MKRILALGLAGICLVLAAPKETQANGSAPPEAPP